MDKKQQALILLGEYLKDNQGLNPESINVCLDAINLSLSWKPKWASEEELKKADAFVSYSHCIGRRKDGKKETKDPFQIQYDPEIYYPGLANIDLAKIISNFYGRGIEKPVFAQWEVATALEKFGIKSKSVAKPREGYLTTQGVIQQFLEDGLRECKSIALVVCPTHSYRAKATTITEASKFGKIFQEILHVDNSNVRQDPESVMYWGRTDKENVQYEIGSRTQHVLFKRTLDAQFFRE